MAASQDPPLKVSRGQGCTLSHLQVLSQDLTLAACPRALPAPRGTLPILWTFCCNFCPPCSESSHQQLCSTQLQGTGLQPQQPWQGREHLWGEQGWGVVGPHLAQACRPQGEDAGRSSCGTGPRGSSGQGPGPRAVLEGKVGVGVGHAMCHWWPVASTLRDPEIRWNRPTAGHSEEDTQRRWGEEGGCTAGDQGYWPEQPGGRSCHSHPRGLGRCWASLVSPGSPWRPAEWARPVQEPPGIYRRRSTQVLLARARPEQQNMLWWKEGFWRGPKWRVALLATYRPEIGGRAPSSDMSQESQAAAPST